MKATDTTKASRAEGSNSGRRGAVRGTLALVKRHPVVGGVLAAIGIGLAIFVLLYFQPQKLFIDDRVNEAMPGDATAAFTEQASGEIVGLAHPGSGRAVIFSRPDGSRFLRLEDLKVDNGPDLFVYLSTTAADAGEDAFPGTFVNLGKLKGNIGSQNYEIPSGVDLSRYRSVAIYCKRFTTPFAAAPIA